MKWRVGDATQWHPVPYAWLPVIFDGVAYWLEYPPWDRRETWYRPETGPHYEYRAQVLTD